jgi:hypothetical protein
MAKAHWKQVKPGNLQEYVNQLAAKRLQITDPSKLIVRVFQLAKDGEFGFVVTANGSGGGTGSRTGQVQALRISGGTNGNLSMVQAPASATTSPKAFRNSATAKMWMGANFQMVALSSGSTRSMYFGCRDVAAGPDRFVMGMRAAASTTNFVAAEQNSGGTPTSWITGPALDTNPHIHEFWRDGSTGHYAVDSSVVGSANIRPQADCFAAVFSNGNASPAPQADWSWLAYAVELL